MAATTQDPISIPAVERRALGPFEAEVARRKLSMDDYRVHFYDAGPTYMIALESRTRRPGGRGADPAHPEIEVHV